MLLAIILFLALVASFVAIASFAEHLLQWYMNKVETKGYSWFSLKSAILASAFWALLFYLMH